jgi:hypothetical protein
MHAVIKGINLLDSPRGIVSEIGSMYQEGFED